MRNLFSGNEYDLKDLVYIPFGADKGDCPYCYYGVLRRDEGIETKYSVREGYICPRCGVIFTELFKRRFKRIAKQHIRK